MNNNNNNNNNNNDNCPLKNNFSKEKVALMDRIKSKMIRKYSSKEAALKDPVILSSVSSVKHPIKTTTILKKPSVLGIAPGIATTTKDVSSTTERDLSEEATEDNESEDEEESNGGNVVYPEATDDTVLGSKRSRGTDQNALLIEFMRASERRERLQEEKHQKLFEEIRSQNATIERLRSDIHSMGGSEEAEPIYRENVGSIIKKDREGSI